MSWADFERIQKALIDNKLEDPEEIFAWIRVTRAMFLLYPVNFFRLWQSTARIPKLKVQLWSAWLSIFTGLLDMIFTLGGEYFDIVITMIKQWFGLIERSEDV